MLHILFPHKDARLQITANDFAFFDLEKKRDTHWLLHLQARQLANEMYASNFFSYKAQANDSVISLEARIVEVKDMYRKLPAKLKSLCTIQNVAGFVEEFKKRYDVGTI